MPRAGLTVLAATIVLAASLPAGAAQVVQGPTLTMNPTGFTPLAGVIEMETDQPIRVQLKIQGGGEQRTVSFPDAQQVHYLPVLGLKPQQFYTVDVNLVPGGFVDRLTVLTPALPADFPTLVTQVSNPVAMEPGYTLLDCFFRAPGDNRPRYTIIVDEAGQVVWYSTKCSSAFRQLVNGNLFYRVGNDMTEVDLLWNEKLRVPLQIPGTGVHHDYLRTPMGTYLALTGESVVVPDFPTSDTDPLAPTAPAAVRDEPVVEFLPDGTLLHEWPLVDTIDPTRIGYLSMVPTSEGFDWAHANAVSYDPNDDSILVSIRHQDAVIKFSRATGNLIWILGPHDNWAPQFQPFLLYPIGTPFRWQYHQHAQMTTGDGTLMLFDNGNYRASPFDGNPQVPDSANFSRGVEYEIDEAAMTVRQVWEYGENISQPLYSGFICDTDWQENTGNVLMTFGAVSYEGGVSSASLGFGDLHTRIIEATRDPVPVEVFDLRMYDPAGGRVNVYRSERIPDLYPQQYVKPPNGVGNTLLAAKTADSIELQWTASPLDHGHDEADYYIVYASASPSGGFQMVETSASPAATQASAGNSLYFEIVAANTAGTSGDEPAP